jgi:hypothetical protein
MPRVESKKKDYKLKDFKGWVVQQMHINHKTQKDVGDALGLSHGRVSQMLKIPDSKKDKGKRIDPDPFSYGQVLTLCEFFGVDKEERGKLLTL